MDRLREMEAFVAVVNQGGFTDAAEKLGLSKSAISKHVSSLEERLGARLLNRTTRRVSPTEIGLNYFDRALKVLAEAYAADDFVTSMQSAPRGSLRISAPMSFGTSHLTGAVNGFLEEYPDVSINMTMDDRFVEIVAEGFDLAVRIGRMEDSQLKARKLSETQLSIVASPEYLKANGTPKTLDELTRHNLLHYSNYSNGNTWRVMSLTGEERQIRAGGRFTANNGDTLMQAAERGLGLVMLPCFIVSSSIKAGRLVRVLDDLPQQTVGIYAVYPPGKYVQPKLRAFIDYLAEYFKDLGPMAWEKAA